MDQILPQSDLERLVVPYKAFRHAILPYFRRRLALKHFLLLLLMELFYFVTIEIIPVGRKKAKLVSLHKLVLFYHVLCLSFSCKFGRYNCQTLKHILSL